MNTAFLDNLSYAALKLRKSAIEQDILRIKTELLSNVNKSLLESMSLLPKDGDFFTYMQDKSTSFWTAIQQTEGAIVLGQAIEELAILKEVISNKQQKKFSIDNISELQMIRIDDETSLAGLKSFLPIEARVALGAARISCYGELVFAYKAHVKKVQQGCPQESPLIHLEDTELTPVLNLLTLHGDISRDNSDIPTSAPIVPDNPVIEIIQEIAPQSSDTTRCRGYHGGYSPTRYYGIYEYQQKS